MQEVVSPSGVESLEHLDINRIDPPSPQKNVSFPKTNHNSEATTHDTIACTKDADAEGGSMRFISKCSKLSTPEGETTSCISVRRFLLSLEFIQIVGLYSKIN